MQATEVNAVDRIVRRKRAEREAQRSKQKLSLHTSLESMVSTNSQAEYFTPQQTIIIFDWDDTLCPSSWIRKNKHLMDLYRPAPNLEVVQRPLRALETRAKALLRTAMGLGNVVIVTNASEPWVEMSCRNFLPGLLPVIHRLPIIYAKQLYDTQAQMPFAGSLLTNSQRSNSNSSLVRSTSGSGESHNGCARSKSSGRRDSKTLTDWGSNSNSGSNNNNNSKKSTQAWRLPHPLSQSGSYIALPMLFTGSSNSSNKRGSPTFNGCAKSESSSMLPHAKGSCVGNGTGGGDHLPGNLINPCPLSPEDQRKAPQRWKEVAFFQEINSFYSRYHHQSWKNVLSIGDSVFERDAVRNVAQMRPNPDKKCRTKTIKLFDEPDISELILQVNIVHDILTMAVQFDGPLDIAVDSQDLQDAAEGPAKEMAWY